MPAHARRCCTASSAATGHRSPPTCRPRTVRCSKTAGPLTRSCGPRSMPLSLASRPFWRLCAQAVLVRHHLPAGAGGFWAALEKWHVLNWSGIGQHRPVSVGPYLDTVFLGSCRMHASRRLQRLSRLAQGHLFLTT